MEPNSSRRQKLNIYSTKEPFILWLNNTFITELVNTIKTVMFDRILPGAQNYLIGRRKLLTNLGTIERD